MDLLDLLNLLDLLILIMFSDIKDDIKKHINNCIENNNKIQYYLNYLRHELIICDNNLNNISLLETMIFYIDFIEIIQLKNNAKTNNNLLC